MVFLLYLVGFWREEFVDIRRAGSAPEIDEDFEEAFGVALLVVGVDEPLSEDWVTEELHAIAVSVPRGAFHDGVAFNARWQPHRQ
jgi:hypothetical protein